MGYRDEDDALLMLAFSVQANPGAYALLLGAGVSAPSGIPTAWGVLEDLTSRIAQLAGEEPDMPVEWFETTYGVPARYETLLERLAPTPMERQRLLRGYFEPAERDVRDGKVGPTAAHRAIARMIQAGAVRVIVTLNFDRLVEKAVRDLGIEPTVIACPSDIEGMSPLHSLECCIIHLHGDYLNPTSMLNTLTELEAYHPATAKLLTRVLEEYGLIIAGWSSTYDPALREAIARDFSGRLSMTWIEPWDQSTTAVELRTLKKGLLLPTDADDGFGKLADAVEAMASRRARHPLTIPVAVENAKRELAGGQVAIRLHDVLRAELSRLGEHDDFHLPDHQDDDRYGGYEAMVERIEEACRVPTALVATLAYWGDSATDRWWLEELERFGRRAPGGGITRLLDLPLVAGSMLFYAAGVSAVAARRYNLLAKLLQVSLPDPHSTGQNLLAKVLDPEFTCGLPSSAARAHSVLQPTLREALGLGAEALDDAWQQFEVIRIAAVARRTGGFHHSYAALREATDELDSATTMAQMRGAQHEVDAARTKQVVAHSNVQTAWNVLSNSTAVGRPHLLTADHRGDEGWQSPVAMKLADEILSAQERHPLVAFGVDSNPEVLAAAVRATGIAAGARGRALAWERVAGSSGTVPMQMWLDSGLAPSELALGR
ncbi:SIR2 family protein [Agromyces sp. H3Y2-19a]|uniref:SIR2 family protein n=1 Tax=Agromyces chromiiresistens TaxID=3030835 RepID=UPI0023BA2EF0|nr:SIR2 family protein [Agromyces chromiiresistens]MDF0512497.1 SIR2 family protein [Agromyces chromiiresistens]